MAKYSEASWDPRGTTPGPKIVPSIVIFHVEDGLGDAKPHDGLEWHFEVRLNGDIQQCVDTDLSAAANYHANSFVQGGVRYGAISIETEGKGPGTWTDAQIASLVKLSEWLMATHPTIQRRVCPSPFEPGFGYHIMFGTPGPWTPVAKSCPGPERIKQFHSTLMPRILGGTPEPPPTLPDPEMEVPVLYQSPSNWYLVTGGNIAHLVPAFAQKHLDAGMEPIPATEADIKNLRRDLFHDLDKVLPNFPA